MAFTECFLALVLSGLLHTTTLELPVEVPEFHYTETGECFAGIPDCMIGWIPGFPDLPIHPAWVTLQRGEIASSIEIVHASWTDVSGTWNLRPLPPPTILSATTLHTDMPGIVEVYEQDSFWPASPVELTGTGYRNGVPCAELIVSPLRYNPVRGTVQRLVDLEIRITTVPGQRNLSAPRQTDWEQMLIITDESIREPFDTLALWRTEGGILTEVVTTDVVYTWPGCDNMERIRNYVIDTYSSNGLDYLLLGGDTDFIPCRYAYAMTYNMGGGRDDSLPCDLYFSDLDGSWNLDGDDTWGELEDDVDLYPDIWVGRAPAEDLEEAWTFVNKTIAYESGGATAHIERSLLAAAVIWNNPYTDESICKEYIDEQWIPDFFENTKCYQSQGTYTLETVVSALSTGTGYVNLNDHGGISCVGVLGPEDVDPIDSDGMFFGMMYSIGCWTSAYDFDTVSEHFLNNPVGCGVSYVGNSSYGWGSPGNPLYGYSDRFDIELWKLLFEMPSAPLGELVGTVKTGFIPFSHQENCYRCLQYMVNLLGDPALRTFRSVPVVPVVQLPEIVTPATMCIPVFVDVPGVVPEELQVCIHDSDFSNYHVVALDESGYAIVDLDSPPAGDITVTVTGTGVKRTTQTVPEGTGSSIVVSNVLMEDTSDYGHLAPGVQADVVLTLLNQGTESLTGIELTAQLISGPAQLTQSSISYGALSPGESGQGDDSLEIIVDETACTGETVHLDIQIQCDQGTWNYDLPLLVYAPGLYFSTYSIDDSSGGNGNGYAEPGESFDLLVDIANIGLMDAQNVSVLVSDTFNWLTWSSDSSYTSSIPADGTGELIFSGSLSTSAPTIAFAELLLDISADPLWNSQDSMIMVVGDFGISDDFESGPNGWTHSGTNDLWHITTLNPHSGSSGWYCGDESSGTYQNGMNCGLVSPTFYIAPEAELTFWSCFDLDLYGYDGLYVLAHDMDALIVDTLDFLGAGGLLGVAQTLDGKGNLQWLPRTYDLSYLEYGSLVRIEFWFYTDYDGDNIEGFYLDDVSVDGFTLNLGLEGSTVPVQVGRPSPNPCISSFSLPLTLESLCWTMSIYDISGRLVLKNSFDEPLTGSLVVDTSDFAPGIYLLKIEADEIQYIRRTVVLGRGKP